jgi:Ca2+-binding EF-hand superfamily protein
MEKIIEAIYDLLGEENRKGENSPPKRVEKIMQKLDKDNDGKLSSEEFINGCLYDDILRSLLAPNAC